jgi:hypothetical protein
LCVQREITDTKKIASRKLNKSTGVKYDWDVILTGFYSSKNYPLSLRRIRFYDQEFKRTFVFYTNNRKVKPETIAVLYKADGMLRYFLNGLNKTLRSNPSGDKMKML